MRVVPVSFSLFKHWPSFKREYHSSVKNPPFFFSILADLTDNSITLLNKYLIASVRFYNVSFFSFCLKELYLVNVKVFSFAEVLWPRFIFQPYHILCKMNTCFCIKLPFKQNLVKNYYMIFSFRKTTLWWLLVLWPILLVFLWIWSYFFPLCNKYETFVDQSG